MRTGRAIGFIATDILMMAGEGCRIGICKAFQRSALNPLSSMVSTYLPICARLAEWNRTQPFLAYQTGGRFA